MVKRRAKVVTAPRPPRQSRKGLPSSRPIRMQVANNDCAQPDYRQSHTEEHVDEVAVDRKRQRRRIRENAQAKRVRDRCGSPIFSCGQL